MIAYVWYIVVLQNYDGFMEQLQFRSEKQASDYYNLMIEQPISKELYKQAWFIEYNHKAASDRIIEKHLFVGENE